MNGTNQKDITVTRGRPDGPLATTPSTAQTREPNTTIHPAEMRPNAGVDFLICGMPRGGTTFFGQLFNAHEDVYCYFMETNMVRHLFMFGGERPFPEENLLALEQWLRQELWPTLVEGTQEARVKTFRRLVRYRDALRAHDLDEPSGPGISAWDENSFESFLQDILDLYRSGAHGVPLVLAGMRVLREHLGRVTGRPVVGEKTPDNLFHIESLQAMDPALVGFCILREPYSTLESMKRRALRNESFYDSAFSTDVLRGIAEYYRHIDAAYSCSLHSEPGRFHVYRFEDLLQDPTSVMAKAYDALGLGMTDAAAQILPQLRIPTEQKHLIDLSLQPAEYRLIDMILGRRLRHFGYEKSQQKPVSDTDMALSEMILPLSGMHVETALDGPIRDTWMMKRSDLFLLFNEDRQRLIIELQFPFPDTLGLSNAELRLSADGRQLAQYEVTPEHPSLRVELPLEDLRDRHVGNGQCATLLTLQSTESFSPITVPGLGVDIRQFSFLIRSCAYE